MKGICINRKYYYYCGKNGNYIVILFYGVFKAINAMGWNRGGLVTQSFPGATRLLPTTIPQGTTRQMRRTNLTSFCRLFV